MDREDRDRREKLLKHTDLPVFNGVNLYGWIARVERYSRIAQFTKINLLDQVSVSLVDDALGWYNWEVNRAPFLSWKNFKDHILLRFGNLRVKGPSQSLFCIRQSGYVGEYVKHFEELSAQVIGLDDNKLERIFLNGLQSDMQELVFMMKPSSLPEMITVAISMEDNKLRQSMRVNGSWKPSENKSSFSLNKSLSTVSNQWTPKPTPTNSQKGVDRSNGVTLSRPQKNHTRAEMDEIRKRRICFKCYGPWGKDHDFPSKELRVMTVLDNFVVEVLQDEDYVELHEEELPARCMTLSFSSLMGISSPSTTKMKGLIRKGEVLFMMNSGATHNFITPMMANRLKLKESAMPTSTFC